MKLIARFFCLVLLFTQHEWYPVFAREATATASASSSSSSSSVYVDVQGGEETISTTAETSTKDSVLLPEDDPLTFFSKVTVAVHRNGEPEACGLAPPSSEALTEVLESFPTNLDLQDNKYDVESFLTRYLHMQLSRTSSPATCQATDEEDKVKASIIGFPGYCDMGPKRTVIQRDHDKLVRVPVSESLPCRFYTRTGQRISSIQFLKDLVLLSSNKSKLDLYAVPAGRVFMFGPSHVGEIFELTHVQDTHGRNLVLQTLSLEPRVFDIYHFFSHAESDELMNKALGETSETHKFHRSTTGTTGANVFNKRTSENAWDTHGKTAQIIKRRCFQVLGFDEYVEEMSDGLQILRYNLTKAYTPHDDYLQDRSGKEAYDYDTAGRGGNRFATILLYFTDLPEGAGGETVFPRAWPPNVPEEERVPTDQAIKQLRESGDADLIKPGSWEEKMVAECRTRLAVRPNATRAVLFYSTFPNGKLDPKSFHGGCPVLNGTKLAANLWTWSGIRPEFEGAPQKRALSEEEKQAKSGPQQISAIFRNSGKDKRFNNAAVYYDEDGFFGNLGVNDPPVRVNTYQTHVWNIKANGKTLKTFVIQGTPQNQEFVV